jgi:transposase
MKKFKIESHFSDKCLKRIMNTQTDVRAFKGWQVIYSVKTNPLRTSKEVALLLGLSRNMVFRIVRLYNKHGKNWFSFCYSGQRGGRRASRCHLSLEDEKLMMKSLENDAVTGKILTFRHIKKTVEARVGKEVSDDYIWDLFSRHGWKKKMPRPHHPKSDMAAREEYKKNPEKIWLPNR